MATKMLSPRIRQDIYNIYGFVRFADEIVDTFHDYDKEKLFEMFEKSMEDAIEETVSVLIRFLNSFQHTVQNIIFQKELIDSFMESMRMDLYKKIIKARGVQ